MDKINETAENKQKNDRNFVNNIGWGRRGREGDVSLYFVQDCS